MQLSSTPPPIPNPDGHLYAPPPPLPSSGPPPRGGCLTAFLILMMVVNPLLGVSYLAFGSAIAAAVPRMPQWMVPLMGIVCFFNLACAIAIWNRKKWGVYGFVTVSILGFVLNAVTLGLGSSLSGLIGFVILLALVKNDWAYME